MVDRLDVRLYGIEAQAPLVDALADKLGWRRGRCETKAFADTEQSIHFLEPLWKAIPVLVISTGPPVDSHTMTLALLADAARRAGARQVVAVVPYLGYSRGDRLPYPGAPIAARVVADILQGAGVGLVVTVDLHNPAIAGFFRIPVIDLSAVEALAARFPPAKDRVVVAPDAGAVKRASRLASVLGAPMAIATKVRPPAGGPRIERLVGDVAGQEALVIDDMVATGETLERVIVLLRESGSTAIDVAATHAVMASGAEARLRGLGIRRFVVTDSLPFEPATHWPGFERVSVAGLIAGALEGALRPAVPVAPRATAVGATSEVT